jgi:cytoskeletal protein CcmA (bactofilin family)
VALADLMTVLAQNVKVKQEVLAEVLVVEGRFVVDLEQLVKEIMVVLVK